MHIQSRRFHSLTIPCLGFLLLPNLILAQQNGTTQPGSYYVLGPGDTLTALPLVKGTMKGKGKALLVYTKVESVVDIPGEQATLRLNPSDAQRFVRGVKGPLPLSLHPGRYATLAKLDVTGGKREWVAFGGTSYYAGVKSQTADIRGIPLDFTRYDPNSIEISPRSPLPPGEYAFVWTDPDPYGKNSYLFYCFGVDTNAAPLASHAESPVARPTSAEVPPAPQPEPSVTQPTPAQRGPTITNDDIIKLVQVKMPDSVIITKIKSSACTFDTGTDGLVRLKQAGVSDAVLQAMLGAGGQPAAEDPSGVLKVCYMAMNDGRYSEAEQYLTSSLRAHVAAHGGIKRVADAGTRNGTIERIEILGAEVRGEGAKIRYKMYYKDGRSVLDDAELIKEGGIWRISH
ncbi:MAG: hypothetical protein ABSE93_15080 [Terriglobia bacterium]